jgi:uncharacterized protein YybS (DUF2232 family)
VIAKEQEQLDIGKIITAILTTTTIIILPGIAWGLFGWLHLLLPLLAFAILNKFGKYTGRKFLFTASIFSLIVYIILGNLELFVFSAIFLLAGYVLFSSFENNESPALSGFKTAVTIGFGWGLVLAFFTWGNDVSPYKQLVTALDLGISEALTYYRDSEAVTTETLAMLETTLRQMKVIVPLIMPAVLGSLVLLVTWFTMILGNTLMIRQNGSTPWSNYGIWQLPEKMVWLAICMGLLALLPTSGLRVVALNALILLSVVYCFQGLAIAVFYMNKWNVPILMRSFFYVIMIIQTFGTIILLVFGIADVWLDLRKIKSDDLAEEENK